MLIEVSKSGVLCHVSEVQIQTFDDDDNRVHGGTMHFAASKSRHVMCIIAQPVTTNIFIC